MDDIPLWKQTLFHIFGGVLPIIRWQTMPCHRDGDPAFADEIALYEANYLTAEWLWHGTTIYVGAVRPART